MNKYLLILIVFFVTGCGSFDLFRSTETKTDKEIKQQIVNDFREFERFSANIPVAYIKSIKLPSGTEVIFRDSVNSEQLTVDSDQSEDSTETESSPDIPSIQLDYERNTESSDSTSIIEKEETTEKVEKETEVDTGSPFLFLFIGIAVALAGIIALYIYKPW